MTSITSGQTDPSPPAVATLSGTGPAETPATPAGGAAALDPKVWKAAQDFEAMALGQMLQPMFDTVDTSQGLFGGGPAEQSFRPMLVTEMAKELEAHGGLGLAQPVYAQMLKMQEKPK